MMNNIYLAIEEKYRGQIKKIKELKKDFDNWLSGKIKEPKTKEVKELMREI